MRWLADLSVLALINSLPKSAFSVLRRGGVKNEKVFVSKPKGCEYFTHSPLLF